jgi:hypothetical protein
MSNPNYPVDKTKTTLENVLNYNSTIMSNTYPDMTQYGVWYKEGFSNDTTNSMNDIINSINENLAQLDFIQTNLNSVNNLNQEALVKQSELLKLKNEDLKKQLQNLEIIQYHINIKERLIDQTNLNTVNQDINIYLLVIEIILAFVMVFFISLYGTGKIDGKKLFLILIIIGVIYIIMYIYTYNIFSFRDAISYLSSSHTNWYLGKELKEWGNAVRDDINQHKQDLKNNWIANNCDCPLEEESQPVQEEYISGIGGSEYGKEMAGYFYNDHSAPAQLLVPSPDSVPTLNDKIEWVDYSANGDISYLPETNKNIYIDNHYYNYKPTQTQSQELLFELNNNGSLVNSSTRTTNI